MTVNSIYSLVNDLRDMGVGGNSISVVDTSTFMSFGNAVLSSSSDKDLFYSTLVDRIGYTYLKAKAIKSKLFDFLSITPVEFGAYLQKVQTKTIARAEEQTRYRYVDPFTVKTSDNTDFTQKLFKARGSYNLNKLYWDTQLNTAFTNESAFASFVNLIATDLLNGVELSKDELARSEIATMIANIVANGKTTQVRHLLTEYNTLNSTNLTADTARRDLEFLKYMCSEMSLVETRMKDVSTLYNEEGAERWSDGSDTKFLIHSEIASDIDSYLQADTFHEEYLAKPSMTKKINYFQNQGTGSFTDTSTISITLDGGNTTTSVADIIAVLYEKDKVGVMFDKFRMDSIYNPASECTNTFAKYDLGGYVDESENGVVFLLD